MIKQQGFDCRLPEIHQIVVTADMGQFVGEHEFQLLRREARDGRCWQEQHRPQEAHDRRHFDQRRFEVSDGTPHPQPRMDATRQADDMLGQYREPCGPQPPHRNESQQWTECQHDDSQCPTCRQPGQGGLHPLPNVQPKRHG